MFKLLFGQLSPPGPAAKLSVLIFHRVLAAPDPLFPSEIDAHRFDSVCGWLRAWFNVLPLDEATTRLAHGSLPQRALAITFDDGYRDNHDVALPILQRHGLCATFFVATGFLDGGRMWNDIIVEAVRQTPHASIDLADFPEIDSTSGPRLLPLDGPQLRRQAIEFLLSKLKYLDTHARLRCASRVATVLEARDDVELMMSSGQVRALHRAGMQIGAHTVSHPILARLGPTAVGAELATSRSVLEALIDEPVTLFAYPNGKPETDYTPATVDLVRRAGFKAAVSTVWGAASMADDPWQLPRFTPWDRSRWAFGARLAMNLRRASPVPQ